MSDAPVQTSFAPMVATGMASSAAGDQVGTALSDIFSWGLQLACHCEPPEAVLNGLHTLCVLTVVGVAYFFHYTLLKSRTS